jgi:hypothetical protein
MVVFWALVGSGLALLLARLIRDAQATRRTLAEASETPVDEASAGEAGTPPAREIETDVARLLAQAGDAAAGGNFRAAIDAAYAALLRKLEGSGVFRVEPDRTNGDHVREVARRLPALRARVAAVVDEVEQVQFGGALPDEARFRTVIDAVRALVEERTAPVVSLVVVVALGVALTACGVDPGRRHDSPSGRTAVMAFLQQYGFDAHERLVPLARLDEHVQQLVILGDATVDGEAWASVRRWVLGGGTLFVAGGARDLPSWIDASVIRSPADAPDAIEFAADQAERFGRVRGAVPGGHELVIRSGPVEDDVPRPLVVRGGAPYAVEETLGDGRIVLLADDGLFWNASLLVPDNARLLAELLREGGRRVDVVGELTGLVAPNPVAAVTRGELSPALLQLAALAAIFFAFRGAHFGRPRDPRPTSRRAFVEHVQALGMLYARARASRHALESYGAYALERLRERMRLAGPRTLEGVAEAVAARTGRPLVEVLRPLVDAHPGSSKRKAPQYSPEDLATLREIATLLCATGGAGEPTRGRRQD